MSRISSYLSGEQYKPSFQISWFFLCYPTASVHARFRLVFRDESWQKPLPLTNSIQFTLFLLTTTTSEDASSSPTLILFAYNVKFTSLRRWLLWLFVMVLQENGTGMCGMLRRINEIRSKVSASLQRVSACYASPNYNTVKLFDCSVWRPIADVGSNFSSQEAINVCVVTLQQSKIVRLPPIPY